ncbi:hypothetical protein SKAU_G00310930 [Synaphobranchus kaupii]|uniref:Uncharacterized protein n=1 Tax=Synaphobranchus kaupii TaxID=118154 RepID=A0A9Q1IJ48_SYNKA|nr:hypothetical protein SKAU_G00310930 [Synaphobranchus kaupii]
MTVTGARKIRDASSSQSSLTPTLPAPALCVWNSVVIVPTAGGTVLCGYSWLESALFEAVWSPACMAPGGEGTFHTLPAVTWGNASNRLPSYRWEAILVDCALSTENPFNSIWAVCSQQDQTIYENKHVTHMTLYCTETSHILLKQVFSLVPWGSLCDLWVSASEGHQAQSWELCAVELIRSQGVRETRPPESEWLRLSELRPGLAWHSESLAPGMHSESPASDARRAVSDSNLV